MVIVNKGELNTLYLNIPGSVGQMAAVPDEGVYYLEFIDDSTGESLITFNDALIQPVYSDRYVGVKLIEGVNDPLNQSLILTSTNKHWHLKVYHKYDNVPNVAPITIPTSAILMIEDTVWTQGPNNETESVYQ